MVAVRLPNWVGDVCMALPAIAALRAAGREPVLFGKRWAGDLLAGMAYRVETLPSGLRAQARAVAASGAREGVLFTNSFGSAFAFWLGGVKATGYRNDLRSWLLGRALPWPRSGHEVESFWRLSLAHVDVDVDVDGNARSVGEGQTPPSALGLRVHQRHRDEAASALTAAGVSGPYTVLCPLAVGQTDGKAKIWPSFPLLCRGLLEAREPVVACPGPGEEQACASALPGAVMLPRLGLGAYAAVLSGSRRVIANDSGPMHLAAAVGAPVLGVFGVSDPGRTSPWSDLASVCGGSQGWPALREVVAAMEALPPRPPPAVPAA